MQEQNITYQKVFEFLKLRQSYLGKIHGGLSGSKKKCGDKWTEKDELELIKISSRRREVDKIIAIIKCGSKSMPIDYYINKEREKINQSVKDCKDGTKKILQGM